MPVGEMESGSTRPEVGDQRRPPRPGGGDGPDRAQGAQSAAPLFEQTVGGLKRWGFGAGLHRGMALPAPYGRGDQVYITNHWSLGLVPDEGWAALLIGAVDGESRPGEDRGAGTTNGFRGGDLGQPNAGAGFHRWAAGVRSRRPVQDPPGRPDGYQQPGRRAGRARRRPVAHPPDALHERLRHRGPDRLVEPGARPGGPARADPAGRGRL